VSQDRSKLRWNGWGWVARKDELAPREEVWAWLASELGMPALLATPPRPLAELTLPASKLSLQDRVDLSGIVGSGQLRDSSDERAFHARGRNYRDLLLLRSGDLSSAADAVIYPRSTDEVLAILALASQRRIAVVPYGGGTSVTIARGECECAIVLDLSDMDRVIAIDSVSHTAEIETGIYGPALESALKGKGLTLGYAPQAFEFSTLGGWIAHDSAHDASGWLKGAKLATPKGLIEADTAELTNLLLGSEGRFGVVTEATLRLKPAAEKCLYRGYLFRDFQTGLAALRSAQQEGCGGTMQLLYDAEQTRFLSAFDEIGKKKTLLAGLSDRYRKLRGLPQTPCLLIAGYEGDAMSTAFQIRRFRAIASRYAAVEFGRAPGESFRKNRLQELYVRDSMLDRAIGMEQFVIATSWSKMPGVYDAIQKALETVLQATAPREGAHGIVLGCVHAGTADGAQLGFTVIFPRTIGADIEQADKIAVAARETILASGAAFLDGPTQDATQVQKGEGALAALRAVKNALDPNAVMNPGKPLP